jgi:hypothetical protein
MKNNPEIPITKAPSSDGGEHGKDLISCYFKEIGNTKAFHLYRSDDTQIHTLVDGARSPVSNGIPFTFSDDRLSWSVPLFAISEESLMAIGVWKSVPKPAPDDPAEWEDPESGTFQAQAGPGADRELKAKALASS